MDQCRTAQPCSKRRTQTDRSLGEHRHAVTDLHIAALRPGDAGGSDVRDHEDLLIRQSLGDRCEIRPRIRHQEILGPRPIDGVPKPPSAHRTVTLRVDPIEAVETLPAGRDRADDDPLTNRILVLQALAELRDHAHGLVPEDQTASHRVLTLDNVNVCAANRRGGNTDDRLSGSGSRPRHLLETQVVHALEHDGLHRLRSVLHFGVKPALASHESADRVQVVRS
jgi:hypothetical protein